MIKPFGKHRTFVKARRNGDVSSNSESVSRTAVRYRVRKKKRLFTVVTVAVASVMIPIMIASAATGDMKMTPQPEKTAQVQAAAQPQETEEAQPASTATPKLTETTQSAAPVASEGSVVTAEGETAQTQAPAAQTPAAEQTQAAEEPAVAVTYMEGMTDPKVHEIQQRLMDLYYMGQDDTTDYFGPATNQALKYFQRKHGLTVDGAAGPETMALLFSENAKEYSMSLGMAGADVENMQERLIELGYPISEATGYFGEETEKAVKYFQRMSGLAEDGSVGHMTEELLYSGAAEKSLEYEQMQADKEAAAQKPAEDNSGKENDKQESSKEDNSSKEDSNKEDSDSKEDSKPESDDSPQEDSAPAEDNSSSSEDSGDSAPSYTADAGSVEAFIAVAEAQLGKPYVLGGKGPNSFDCSGLIYYALRESGNDVPYRTSGGWRSTDYPTITSISDLQRGDIICMDGHVAIYLGDNTVLDASSSQNAMVTREFGSWFRNGFICAKRPL